MDNGFRKSLIKWPVDV